MSAPEGTSNVRLPTGNVQKATSENKQARIPPNQRKNFQKIMEKEEEDVSSTSNEGETAESTDKPLPPVSSLFTRKQSQSDDQGSGSDSNDQQMLTPQSYLDKNLKSENVAKESPMSLYKQVAKPETNKAAAKPKSPSREVTADAGSDIAIMPKDKSPTKVRTSSSRFEDEHSDLSSVTQMGGIGVPVAEVADHPEQIKTTNIAQIKEIVDQIVDKMYTLDASGKTDTIVTLKYPPIFDGAQVVLTSFKSANKEFNIAFENLRPEAKQLIDNNINSLKMALEESGYARAIHIVTTTTIVEHRIQGQTESQFAGRDNEKDQQGNRQKKREQKEEELA